MKKLSEKDKKLFERNISLGYIIGALMWGRFFIPVLALFYIASQVSLEQFTIIMAVFSLSTLLLEIPTGVVADLLGKKKTLLLSRGMYIIEIAIIAFCDGFWPFLIAKVISGVGVSLGSGTNSALVYDTLKKLGREEEHKVVSGKAQFISNIAMAFVFIIGAYLFSYYYKLPAYVSLPIVALGFILTFFLKEPYEPVKKFNIKNSILHLKEGISYFFKKPYLVYLAFFTLIIGSINSMMLSLSSSYLQNILIPISVIGIIAFIANLLSAYSSKRAHKWEEKIGEKKSLILIQFIVLVSVFCMGLLIPKIGVLFFLLIPFIDGFYGILLSDYTNRHVEHSHRATMLSINNMFDNIGIFILFPILGYSIKVGGMSFSYLYLAGFILIYVIGLYFYSKKKSVNVV